MISLFPVTASRTRAALCVLALSSIFVGRIVPAATLAVGPQSGSTIQAAPGGSTDVCIFMAGGGGRIAGIQLNLRWDGTCVNVVPGDGNSAQCRSNSSTGKNVQTSIGRAPCGNDPNCLTAFFLSVADTSPIPDGQLFCCTFSVVPSPAASRCDISLSNTAASDSNGSKENLTGQNGSIYITSSGGGAAPVVGGPGPGAVSAPNAPAPGAVVPGAVVPGAGAPAPGGGGAPKAGAALPVVPAPLPGVVQSGQAPAPQAGVPSGEAPPLPTAVVPSTPQPHAVATAQRTPVAVATPAARATAQAHATAAAVVQKTPAAATPVPATPRRTPHRRPKKQKKPTPHEAH